MKRILAAAASMLVLAGAAAAAPTAFVAHVHGVVRVVPNTMMCVPNVVCNAYHGPVVFCLTDPGLMIPTSPCKKPAAATATDKDGGYSATVPSGFYTVYVHGFKKPWTVNTTRLKAGDDTYDFAVNRITG